MSSENPLDDWKFLVGEWRGGSPGRFGGKGEIETTATFTLELNDRFIMNRHESHRDGKLENAEIGLMYYDVRNKKFLRKTGFSYGFVNNEIEYHRTGDEIRFEIAIEPIPQAFDGMRWRSYLVKVSEDEIREGLESAKEGADFENYGDSVLKRV
ncbi:MAG: hypothetical protein ACW99U_08905 [Candidatus Thorarchaeota archaeon]|jgi:hypothetical protein